MNRLEKPIFTKETIQAMEDMSFFTHALIFDDLLIVAQKETNCFVLKTSEGLIVIDAIWPSETAFHAIVDAITSVGWEADTIRKLVLTHGHVDHVGCGRWFVEKYHVDTYLSEVDDIFWEEHPTKPDRPETWKDYEITNHIKDGDVIELGDKKIFVYSTPGHTPGCMSFIFPVADDGKEYMAALWGGTTPPWTRAGVEQYLKSLEYFSEQAEKKHVKVALSNHTAIDNGLERIAYSRVRLAYMPNIYVVGEDGFQKYCQVFRTLSNDMLQKTGQVGSMGNCETMPLCKLFTQRIQYHSARFRCSSLIAVHKMLKYGWYALLLAMLGDLLIPFILAPFYKGYSHLTMAVSVLGNTNSPVRLPFNIWMLLEGLLFLSALPVIYNTYVKASKPLTVTVILFIAIFAIGACIFTCFFSVGETKEMLTMSSKMHGIGSVTGFMLFLIVPLLLARLSVKTNDRAALFISTVCFILAFFFFVLFIMADKPEFQGTFIAKEGLWERLNLLFMFVPLIYISIEKISYLKAR